MDDKAWEAKDKRIVRQSSLKVAADIVLSGDLGSMEEEVDKIKSIAEDLVNWVYMDERMSAHEEDVKVKDADGSRSLPKKLLDAVERKYRIEPDTIYDVLGVYPEEQDKGTKSQLMAEHTNASIPLPTPEQQKVLDAIERKYGIKPETIFNVMGFFPDRETWNAKKNTLNLEQLKGE